MSLLDRIGKVLKGATQGSTTEAETPKTPEATTPTTTAKTAEAPSSPKGLFGDPAPDTAAAKPAPSATADKPAPSTKGLFGGTDAETETATPPETKKADAPSTKGLFGGADTDTVESKAAEKTEDTKGLFGAAAAPGSTVEQESTGRKLQSDAPTATVEKEATARKLQADAPSSTVPAPDAQERQIMPVHPKVLMVVHNPPVPSEGNKRLTEIFKWHDPDKLAKGYIEDLKKVSGGYLDYEIVERIDSDIFPPKTDGFAYTPDDYVKVMRGEAKAQDPDWLDYHKRIETFDLQNRFNNGDFDEVWFFSFPYAGEYESIMGGPGGFWCNAPAIKNTDRFKRRFVMMGFNMERGVDCMLENFGHRTESIMTELYKRRGKNKDMWKLFTQYEKQNPGDAQCGWMHYAPNSQKDYDWGNTTPVTSYCDDWYTYPDLPRQGKTETTKDWGGGEMRAHHIWWFDHIPKITGETDGISNNWWEYMVDPNKV